MAARSMAAVAGTAGALAVALAAWAPAAGQARPAGRAAGGLAGKLLVARPEMNDPRFSGTVVFLVRHDAEGAMGLVVNRPFKEIPVADLLGRLGLDREGVSGSLPMHYGGPVEPGRVFVLHTDDWRGEGTRVVAGGIALSGPAAVLRAIGTGHGPRRVRLVLSYSGWGPGQLEREMRAGAWVAVPADPALVFDEDPRGAWERALGRREIDL